MVNYPVYVIWINNFIIYYNSFVSPNRKSTLQDIIFILSIIS